MSFVEPSRARLPRAVLAVLLWLAGPGVAGIARVVVQKEMNAGRHFDGNPLITDVIPVLPELFPLFVLVYVLPLVAYRRRDALLYLIPFYGWVFFAKASWRLAGLPYVAWFRREPAPETEAPA